MKAEQRRIKRLQRLERVRALAAQAAAAESARAEGTLAQLQALVSRTGSLMAEYAGRIDASDGQHLIENTRFVAALHAIAGTTRADADQARALADRKQIERAEAERRRASVEDRIRQEQADLARTAQSAPASALAGTRKPNWHGN